MKKHLLFSLIGALVIFIWQFLSYAAINFHAPASRYTPQQQEILTYFEQVGLEEGMYILGQPDPNAPEGTEDMDSYMNKPWAVINYQQSMSPDMVMPMIRSLLVSFVIAFLLFWMFTQQKNPSLKNRLYLALGIGLIGFFFTPYTNFIWYKNPDIWGYLIDGIAPWMLLGYLGHRFAK